MGNKILDKALNGCLLLEEETLSDGSKVYNVRITGDYVFPAAGLEQAASVFLVASRILKED